MKKEQFLFSDFAEDLINDDMYKYWFNNIFKNNEVQSETANEELHEWMEDYDDGCDYEEFLNNIKPFVLAYSCNKETFINYLEHYLDAATRYYNYWEYEYSDYEIGYPYFDVFNPYVLILCSRYYDSINEKDKAAEAVFYILCSLVYVWLDDTCDLRDNYFLSLCENKYDSIEPYIYNDWQAIHPLITWNIGHYYLLNKNYKKALKFFSMGSVIDYDERDSFDALVAVGRNQYELGMMYYKGLGVEVDAEKAFEYFQMAADNAGEPTIPAIQDMTEDGLLPIEIDPMFDCLYGYGSFNVYNINKQVYYTLLNYDQFDKLKNSADYFLNNEQLLDFGLLCFLSDVYKYRLDNMEKYNLVENKKYEFMKSIPVQDRDESMDNLYVSSWKKEWEQTIENPDNISGIIPQEPKVGDMFTFGTFNNEPIEWKVMETFDDGTVYVISNKILFKMSYDNTIEWLNTKFYEKVFTEEEKKHIVAHDYPIFRKYEPTYLHFPDKGQLKYIVDNVYEEEVEETALAKQMSKNFGYYDAYGDYIHKTSQNVFYKSPSTIRGIRPAMDLYINIKK